MNEVPNAASDYTGKNDRKTQHVVAPQPERMV